MTKPPIVDRLLERDLLPEWLIRRGVRRLLAERLRSERAESEEAQLARRNALVADLRRSPIALHTAEANREHYEVPTAFFQRVLGRRLKYSSGFWPEGVSTLDRAEEAMLELTTERARLADGQKILDLGCGWGSLTLWTAERFPGSRITAVSNSRTQKEYVDEEIERRGLRNVETVVADVNDFDPGSCFDRVVSVEMFEHMRNYQELLARIASWLEPQGLLFVHIFSNRRFAYPFEDGGPSDWMARHFFSGGLMPSDDLLLCFQESLRVQAHWRVGGRHYARTCEAWLENLRRQRSEIEPILAATYGEAAVTRWFAYWRIFFIACAELFAWDGGNAWMVSHYLFGKPEPAPSGASRVDSATGPHPSPDVLRSAPDRARSAVVLARPSETCSDSSRLDAQGGAAQRSARSRAGRRSGAAERRD
jgi:cyclopropane-fatty-acyl-phospholipid synthase